MLSFGIAKIVITFELTKFLGTFFKKNAHRVKVPMGNNGTKVSNN